MYFYIKTALPTCESSSGYNDLISDVATIILSVDEFLMNGV